MKIRRSTSSLGLYAEGGGVDDEEFGGRQYTPLKKIWETLTKTGLVGQYGNTPWDRIAAMQGKPLTDPDRLAASFNVMGGLGGNMGTIKPIAPKAGLGLGPEVGVKINSPKIIEGDYFPDPDTHRGRMAIQGGALGAKPNIDRIIRTLENHGMDWKYSENGGITAYAEVVGPNGKVFKEGKHFNEKTSLGTLTNWLGYASAGPVHGMGLVKRNGW